MNGPWIEECNKQQIANILEQPISLQTSRRKTRKRPYSLVLFVASNRLSALKGFSIQGGHDITCILAQ